MLPNWTRFQANRIRKRITKTKPKAKVDFRYESMTDEKNGENTESCELIVTLTEGIKSERYTTRFQTGNKSVALVEIRQYNPNPGYGKASISLAKDTEPDTINGWADLLISILPAAEADIAKNIKEAKELKQAEEKRQTSLIKLADLVKEEKLGDIGLINYEYGEGDSRSHGHLTVNLSTDAGKLTITTLIGTSGDTEDLTATLNEVECDTNELGSFDPGTPHYYGGDRAIKNWKKSAKENIMDAVSEWLIA